MACGLTRYKGVIEEDRNPFTQPSCIEQGYSFTEHRRDQAEALLGKTVQEIRDTGPNEGEYPAFVAIWWGYAEIKDNRLTSTAKGSRSST